MKFTNMENNLSKVILNALYVFIILVVLAIMGVMVWVDLSQGVPMISILWFMFIPCFGMIINWFLGAILGDKIYNTGLVYEGRSMLSVVKTPKYYTRRMFLCIVELVLFLLLKLRFILWLFDPEAIAIGIVGIVGSIIAMVICFIMGMSSYEQSSLNANKDTKTE